MHCLTIRLDFVAVLRGKNVTALSICATRTSFEVHKDVPGIHLTPVQHQLDRTPTYQLWLLAGGCSVAIATLQTVLGRVLLEKLASPTSFFNLFLACLLVASAAVFSAWLEGAAGQPGVETR